MVFGFGKKKKQQVEKVEAPAPQQEEVTSTEVAIEPEIEAKTEVAPEPVISEPTVEPTSAKKEKRGFFKRLTGGLSKTRKKFSEGVVTLFAGKKSIDDDLLEELETYLLSADLGIEASEYLIEELTKQISRKAIKDPEVLLGTLKQLMTEMLLPAEQALPIEQSQAQPFTIMMIGINGSGKTTTTGKMAKRFKDQGKNLMLAAADTFRAAAVEQLQRWGERNDVPVVAQKTGADSAAVSFDALHSAKAKQADVLIVDTAGRLHTQDNLMEELKKIKRVMQKVDAAAPQEVLLVLDSGIGQNALQQAKLFNEAIGVTGLVLTKLDGTAKGGIIFAIVKELGLPIRFIGVGEQAEDLQPFVAKDFVDALFAND
jgi:fused signal recognition particle receptor